jgi:hypothetical protein
MHLELGPPLQRFAHDQAEILRHPSAHLPPGVKARLAAPFNGVLFEPLHHLADEATLSLLPDRILNGNANSENPDGDITLTTMNNIVALARLAGPEEEIKAKELIKANLEARARIPRRCIEAALAGFTAPLAVLGSSHIDPSTAMDVYAGLRINYNLTIGTGVFAAIDASGLADQALIDFAMEIIKNHHMDYLTPETAGMLETTSPKVSGIANSRYNEWVWGLVPELGIVLSSILAGKPEQIAVYSLVMGAVRSKELIQSLKKLVYHKNASTDVGKPTNGDENKANRKSIRNSVSLRIILDYIGLRMTSFDKSGALGSAVISTGNLATAEINRATNARRKSHDMEQCRQLNEFISRALADREKGFNYRLEAEIYALLQTDLDRIVIDGIDIEFANMQILLEKALLPINAITRLLEEQNKNVISRLIRLKKIIDGNE